MNEWINDAWDFHTYCLCEYGQIILIFEFSFLVCEMETAVPEFSTFLGYREDQIRLRLQVCLPNNKELWKYYIGLLIHYPISDTRQIFGQTLRENCVSDGLYLIFLLPFPQNMVYAFLLLNPGTSSYL